MSATTSPSVLRTSFASAGMALLLGLIFLGLLFLPECRAAVEVWLTSTAYGHCFLVLPMALYLAWDRREILGRLCPTPTSGFAVLCIPIALAWFAAERLGIMEGRQLAALAGVEMLFLGVLGWKVFRAMAAPLLYLVFLVPFGAFVTPALQDFTAGFIAMGLHVLGIPAYITDLTIEISAGTFYVAEACAGLRFLIAAVSFGVFYALLNYRSPGRRLAFVAASVVVPIIANGFRALGIVVLGNYLGSAEAAAADHVIYGWGFFSAIMLLLVACGMPWREFPMPAQARNSVPMQLPKRRLAAATIAVLLPCAAGPVAAALCNQGINSVALDRMPVLNAPPGCTANPVSEQHSEVMVRRFTCSSHQLAITVQAFPARSTADRLLRQRSLLTGAGRAEESETKQLPVRGPGNGTWYLVQSFRPDGMVTYANWSGGVPTQGGLSGRLHQAHDSLLGAAYLPMLMVIAVENPVGHLSPSERQSLAALLSSFVDAQRDLTVSLASLAKLR